MKKSTFAIVIFTAVIFTLAPLIIFATENNCVSSGLKTASAAIRTTAGCLCGVELIPASDDATLIIYDNATTTSGSVLFKTFAAASGSPSGFSPASVCIPFAKGAYVAITGPAAAYILWTR